MVPCEFGFVSITYRWGNRDKYGGAIRPRNGLKVRVWLLVLLWEHPQPMKDCCMIQGPSFK